MNPRNVDDLSVSHVKITLTGIDWKIGNWTEVWEIYLD